MEFKKFVESHAENCPSVTSESGHDFSIGIDLGGGKDRQNLGRYYRMVCRFTKFADIVLTGIYSVKFLLTRAEYANDCIILLIASIGPC
jgi:hypothetical protein